MSCNNFFSDWSFSYIFLRNLLLLFAAFAQILRYKLLRLQQFFLQHVLSNKDHSKEAQSEMCTSQFFNTRGCEYRNSENRLNRKKPEKLHYKL